MFRADNMAYAYKYLLNMFGMLKLNPDNFIYTTSYYIDRVEIITFIIAILCAVSVFKGILEIKIKWKVALINVWLLVLFIMSMATIAASTYNPFIYFRF